MFYHLYAFVYILILINQVDLFESLKLDLGRILF